MAKSYKTHVFRLRALTNLHAGAGDSFYGAVDKMVQRDAASNLPVVHSHSLKGALREYFEEELSLNRDFVNRVFGTPVKGKAEDAKPGAYRFFSADLAALPVPEENPDAPEAFHLAADGAALQRVADRLKQMGCAAWADTNALLTELQGNGGLPLKKDGDFPRRFREAAAELPVVARNCLDNGKSENLWYEELVPRESVFLFAVQSGPTRDKDGNDRTAEDETLFLNSLKNKTVQIGANATVGYGYCLLTLLTPDAV